MNAYFIFDKISFPHTEIPSYFLPISYHDVSLTFGFEFNLNREYNFNAQVDDSAVEAADGAEVGGEAEAAAAASSDSSAPRSWSSLVKSGGGAPGKPPVAPQQGQAPPTQAR